MEWRSERISICWILLLLIVVKQNLEKHAKRKRRTLRSRKIQTVECQRCAIRESRSVEAVIRLAAWRHRVNGWMLNVALPQSLSIEPRRSRISQVLEIRDEDVIAEKS
ncbi:hypothetical protein R1flu_009030 [Riccia fluitans]|uniref:Secreted protein n=1 Tax=Riccia fluitans TaxID=41844 RepID=A0ABD1Z0W8_9MARC